jgi:hypothetical protein
VYLNALPFKYFILASAIELLVRKGKGSFTSEEDAHFCFKTVATRLENTLAKKIEELKVNCQIKYGFTQCFLGKKIDEAIFEESKENIQFCEARLKHLKDEESNVKENVEVSTSIEQSSLKRRVKKIQSQISTTQRELDFTRDSFNKANISIIASKRQCECLEEG